jgi:hypothetical protein
MRRDIAWASDLQWGCANKVVRIDLAYDCSCSWAYPRVTQFGYFLTFLCQLPILLFLLFAEIEIRCKFQRVAFVFHHYPLDLGNFHHGGDV